MSHHSKKQFLVGAVVTASLLVLTLAFFYKIAFTNRVLVGLDVFTYFYPYRDYASEVLRSGRLPLWNPYLFMGTPLLANSQAAVLYPPNWLLMWLSAPKQVAWSIVLHVWLTGAGTYLFCRHAVVLDRWPALAAAIVFSLGGFIGAQVEHVNQLSASAWLPWLLLAVEAMIRPSRHRWLALPAGSAVVAMMLLAGHTQAAYIGLFGVAIYALIRDLGRPLTLRRFGRLGALAIMTLAGAMLAAAQILPTAELSRLSIRSGGLGYREAISFSLKPSLVFKAFLPPYAWEPPFSEYIAYIGLSGLLLAAAGAWAVLRRREVHLDKHDAIIRYGIAALILAGLGVVLAFGGYNPLYYVLYKVVPGFSLFRAPARWLLLYGMGAAITAGIGCQMLPKRVWQVAATLLLAAELFIASRGLAYNQPTAPAAFDSMRTAPAHLLVQTSEPNKLFRFVSMSDILYDPGDLGDLQAMYQAQLSEPAIYDLIVATKMKEVLAFNLPLRFRLFSVDGYDGGLLPLARYLTLERLFLDEDDIWSDGRLRQQLRQVPPARLLGLLNVKYVITDKTQDVWIDEVYYDLEHTIPLGQVTLTDLPAFTATQLGVVSYLTGTASLADGTPVALLTITDTAGLAITATLQAGEHTAEGLYDSGRVIHRQARVGHSWRDEQKGSDYVARLGLGGAMQPAAIEMRSLLPAGEQGQIVLRGMALIDDRTGTSRNLAIDPAYRLVHSGDVKIYQNLAVLPRARIVYQAWAAADDEEALAILSDPAFDPSRETVLAGGSALASSRPGSAADIVAYEPEWIEVRAALAAPGYLVLADTYYPGWQVEVDGRPAEIVRADLTFRAVALEAGEHTVEFRFEPASIRLGLGISLAAWLGLGLVAVIVWRIGRRARSSV